MTDTPLPPYGEPTPYPQAETVAVERGGRRGLLIGAGAAVLAVVAGAAVYATTALSGGGRQPDEVVPKSTFAYVKLDLDPAANQKLAARTFFGKFDDLKDSTGDEENVLEDVLADLVTGDGLDYARDVKPWFDKRAAVAAFPGRDGTTNVVAALRSKDDEQARAALDRVRAEAAAEGDDVAYRITKGYVVVGSETTVAEAVALTEKESLRDNQTYREDVARLDGDQVAVAWTNIGEAFDAVKSGIPYGDLLPGIVTDRIRGRLVAGLHLTGDYAEVQTRAFGTDTRAVPPATDHTVLTGLPATTMAAVSFGGLRQALVDSAGGATGLELLLGRYLEGSGLTLDQVLPVLGTETVLAAGPAPNIASPRIALVSKVTEPEQARRVAETFGGLLGFFGVEAKGGVDGDTFAFGTPPAYTDEVLSGDGLGSSPTFTKAMGDVKGSTFAAYVDAKAAAPLAAGFFGAETPLTALGVVGGYQGADGWLRVRFVVE